MYYSSSLFWWLTVHHIVIDRYYFQCSFCFYSYCNLKYLLKTSYHQDHYLAIGVISLNIFLFDLLSSLYIKLGTPLFAWTYILSSGVEVPDNCFWSLLSKQLGNDIYALALSEFSSDFSDLSHFIWCPTIPSLLLML